MEDQEWVETTRDLVEKLNCYLDQGSMERLLSLYLLEDDPQQKLSIKNDIETILGPYAPYLFFSDKPILPSPTSEECEGEITLGNVIQGEREIRPFSINLQDINKHMAIFNINVNHCAFDTFMAKYPLDVKDVFGLVVFHCSPPMSQSRKADA